MDVENHTDRGIGEGKGVRRETVTSKSHMNLDILNNCYTLEFSEIEVWRFLFPCSASTVKQMLAMASQLQQTSSNRERKFRFNAVESLHLTESISSRSYRLFMIRKLSFALVVEVALFLRTAGCPGVIIEATLLLLCRLGLVSNPNGEGSS